MNDTNDIMENLPNNIAIEIYILCQQFSLRTRNQTHKFGATHMLAYPTRIEYDTSIGRYETALPGPTYLNWHI